MLDNIQECFWCVWRECCGVRVVLMTVLLFLWIPPTTTYTNSTTNGSLSLPLLSQDILARYPGQDDYISPTRVVVVAEGGVADLPCNLTSPLTSDPALLVLWYKQGIVKPIYSYDARASLAAHYRDSLYLGARVVFYAPTHAHNEHGDSQAAYGSTPAHASYLRIHGVLARDHGTYRCRVDFHTSPTLTFTTNLTVVVQPRHIAIYADGGVKVGAMAGPYAEGDTLRLTCRVTGGSPAPQVTWREGQEVEDLTSEIREGREVRNMLVVQGLSRSDLRRVFTCQAVNSNLTEPLTASTTLNLNLRPLWVRLLSSREPLSAGWLYCLVCQVVGARPPPVFTWYLGATILTSHTEQSSDDDNVTWSELRWVPRQEDDKKVLSCLAFSPALPSLTLSDDWTLDIYYLPVARLEPGRSVNLGDIKEGDDVYFVCYITSNPSIYKLFWIHEGQELHHNVSAGVIMSNQSLVLQRVSRAASGQYSCVASNIQGDGHSNPQLLRVKYAPVCRHKQMVYLGASKYEQISLTCDLDAYPTPSHFRWTFNNSGESVDVPQEHIVAGGWRSTVTYAPNTDLDYGTLLCWGLNSVGVQRRPCVFHVFPADRPDPVHNCTVHVSMAAVNVVCMAGFDGGLPQTFILELYESSHGRLLANSTSTVPRFSVEGLEAGMALQGVVYSFNAKGRGEEVALSALTLTHLPEKHTAAVKPSPGPAPPTVGHRAHTTTVAVLVGVAAGALLVVVIVCVAVRVRGRAGVGAPAGSLAKTNPETSLKDSNLRQDENPDVIPQSETQSMGERRVRTITTAATLLHTYQALQNYQPASSGTDAGDGDVLLHGGISGMSLKLNNWNPKHPTSASLPHTATCLQHVSPPLQHASVLLQHAAIPLQHATVPLQRAAPPLQQLLTRSSNDNDRFSLYQQKPGNNTIKAVDGYNSHSQELQQESKPLRSTAVAENQGRPSLTPSSAAKGQEHFSLIFSTTKEPQHAQLWLSSAAKEKKLKFNLAPKERAHTMLRSKSVPKERAHAMLKSNSVPKERAHTMLRANSVPKERAHAMLKSNSVPKVRAHTMLRSKSAAKRLEDSPFTATLSAREQDDAPFISPATAVQEYLMTCEDQPGEPDACVPLIAGQKESSV